MVELLYKARPGEARIIFNTLKAVIEERVITKFYADHQETVKQMFLDKLKVDVELDELQKRHDSLIGKYGAIVKQLKEYGKK